MRITIEGYRLMLFVAFASFVATVVAWFLGPLPFNEILLSLPMILAGLYGALTALTNLKKGRIEEFWKKENKILIILFQSGSPLIAYDESGAKYKIGVLFIPQEIK